MNNRQKLGIVFLYLAAGLVLLYGVRYSFASSIMAYHEAYLGSLHGQLDVRIGNLLVELMGISGGGALSLGVTMMFLITIPLRRGETWARWALFVVTSIYLLPLLARTLRIGEHTPWWLNVTLILTIYVSLLLTIERKNKG